MDTKAKVLVTGGREFTQRTEMFQVLDKWAPRIGSVISGMSRGADQVAAQWARSRNVDLQPYPAQWDRHGKSAGYRRNEQMLKEAKPDVVLAFTGGVGTDHMKSIALIAGVKVLEIIGTEWKEITPDANVEIGEDEGEETETYARNGKLTRRGVPAYRSWSGNRITPRLSESEMQIQEHFYYLDNGEHEHSAADECEQCGQPLSMAEFGTREVVCTHCFNGDHTPAAVELRILQEEFTTEIDLEDDEFDPDEIL